jgi:flagellum-specific peptidoglycan hydrolase FlgJ
MEYYLKKFVIMLACFSVFTMLSLKTSSETETTIKTENIIEKPKPTSSMVVNYLNQTMEEQIDNYVTKSAPTSDVSAAELWRVSKKYNINILLILAQAHLESHFGTKGKASYTKSVFNVGAWDDGQIRNRYKEANESIEPYAKLLSTEYGINKATNLDSLLVPGRFKNHAGNRYASSKNYERALRHIIRRIKRDTDIDEYSILYNKLNKIKDEHIN